MLPMERGGDKLSKYERENLLIKLEKEFAFAGAVIPVEIEADNERIKLRSFVFEMSQKRGSLNPEEIRKIDDVIGRIRRKNRISLGASQSMISTGTKPWSYTG